MDNRNPGQPLQSARCLKQHPSHPPHRLAVAVVLALGTLIAQQAEGSGSCTRANTVISSAATRACVLGNQQSLEVTASGAITVANGAAVSVGSGTTAKRFMNNGNISGGYGMLIDGGKVAGSVVNASGSMLEGAMGAFSMNKGTITGALSNAGTVHMTGTGAAGMAIVESALNGGLNNSGTISAPSGAAGLAVVSSTVKGDIKNSGSLTATSQGLLLDHSQVSGALRNSGALRSGSHSLLMNESSLGGSLVNSGEFLATTLIYNSTIGGDFSNSGRLFSGYTGMVMFGSTVKGSFTNRGTISSSSGVLIRESTLGSLLNTGTIKSHSSDFSLYDTIIKGDVINRGTFTTGPSGYAGLSLVGGSIGGNLINYGTLSGGDAAIALRGEQEATVLGSIINRGKVTGATGIELKNTHIGGSLINSGTITGAISADYDGSGLGLENTDIKGDFRNSGTISGATYGVVWAAVKLGGDLVNSGTLAADSSGLVIAGSTISGDLLNSGRITGTVAGMILGTDKIGGDVINTGTIKGGAYPFYLNDTTVGGRVINRGSVSGDTGINLIKSTVGGIENRGSVRGTATGLRLTDTTVSGSLVNTGLISGSKYSLYVDADSSLKTLTVGGNDTARFQGALYAPKTDAYLYSGATYTLLPGDRWTVDSLSNRGTLVLGAPAKRGTIATVTGDYVQSSGAVLRTEVTDGSHYGQLVVSGTATLPSQARIDVDVAKANQPFTVSRLQDVIKAGTLKSNGTFAVTSNSALFNFGAVKDANTVDLTLAAKTSSGVGVAATEAGLTGASGAAQVLDQQLALGSASALTPYFVSATSNAEVASRLAQTLPQTNASLRASQAALSAIGLAVQERMGIANGLLSADGLNNAPGLWSKPFSYASGRTGGSSGSVIGMDTRLSSTSRAGFAFAYANAETANVQGAAQSSQLDLWQFLGYRSYALDRTTELMLYAGAGNNSVQGERTLALSGVSGTAKGDYDSVIATVGASLGRTLQLSDRTQLLPALRLDFNHIRDEAYREHGSSGLAPLLLNVEERHSNQLIAGLDGTLAHAFTPRTALKLNLGVGYDLINDDGAVKAAFAGAPDQTFTTPGDKASPWLWRSGAGLATTFSNGAELSVNYDAQTRSDYTDQTASVKFRLPF
ncbi:autotransporter outer membrane beta-barrel domain-containing protein [Pseudomonas japonica]|uniref:autotransporter outer membrane beta-barrel domain-containing protein n=2 Tax=Pseudomonas japonica TaxID=256466 RepID=UPI0015E48003|nr:autotransporter domain-containing protein [Pseudomonas japonica]MBA1291671.1 autotransporter domain-containing protein [Pseudomonas japonica]